MQLLIRKSRSWLIELKNRNKSSSLFFCLFNDTFAEGWILQLESKLSELWIVLYNRVYHTLHSGLLIIA